MAPRPLEGPDRAVPGRRLAGDRGRRARGRRGGGGAPAAGRPARLDRPTLLDPDRRPAGAGRPVHRGRFRPVAPGRQRGGRFGRALQRDQSAGPVASVVPTVARPAQSGLVQPLPPEGLPAGRPPLPVGPPPRPRLSRLAPMVGADSSRRVAPCSALGSVRRSHRGARPSNLPRRSSSGGVASPLGMDDRPSIGRDGSSWPGSSGSG